MSWLILLLCASVTLGAAPIRTPTPPPPPDVPPVIADSYPTDRDGNRINDSLESGVRSTGLQIAQHERVRVELVFNAPVTQKQIDEFLRLDGEITYIFQAISYGWNGSIPSRNVGLLPAAMGPTLVQVEPTYQFEPYMDMATQTGRVRPVWKAGFANHPDGLRGSPNTTIGFVGDGVDDTHVDLHGRCVYWKDFTDDNEASPVDFDGHDSVVVGVAVGTGEAGGAEAGELRYTMSDAFPYPIHLTEPICLPSGSVTVTSLASWTGGNAQLDYLRWKKGTDGDGMALIGRSASGKSPLALTNTFGASNADVFSIMLSYYSTFSFLDGAVVNVTVSSYPGVGDGFNKFSGVAPGCKWAAAKVFERNGDISDEAFETALDDLVVQRTTKNIKIINISHGLRDDWGDPEESASLRNKVNSIVNNGIVVVVAAGNSASREFEFERKMADPARAAMAITVGASSDLNLLTSYSTYGFFSPRTNAGEDFKPDLIAPGGSSRCTSIMSVDSSTSDGYDMDKVANDYTNLSGTSFAAPFVAGCAALVIEAMEKQGLAWNYNSADQPKFVKMLLCATASETNANREGKNATLNPSLNRAGRGPNAFPAGKDAYEGYGLINADAAVEAVSLTHAPGSTENIVLGGDAAAKRVWARTVNLRTGCDLDVVLSNPANADADLYLYSMTPSNTGTPTILASSADPNAGKADSLHYAPTADMAAMLVVKRISGEGTFILHSTQAGPPTAEDIVTAGGINAPLTITLKAGDDGKPNPPGAISYTIVSLPKNGKLQSQSTGAAITTVPMKLPNFADKVTYVPNAGWLGEDSFTYYADDGGTAPFGGRSNTATVKITVVREVTVEYQVAAGVDDAFVTTGSSYQRLDDAAMAIGNYTVGMRFCNVTIPKGAQIKSATLKICSYTNLLRYSVECAIKAEAADNPADFSGAARGLGGLSTTGAATTWSLATSPAWAPNTWYDSPDISAVVQEIVNRSGWSAGNALAIIFAGNSLDGGERRFWSYDGDSAKAARLIVTYQPR